MKKSLLLMMLLFLCGAVFAQQTVRGRVTSKADGGEGLPGVTVLVKGTTTGTVTDVDGNFTLQVPSSDATLLVSFVGYVTQDVPVNGRSTINVELAEDQEVLDEVVVVGYGEMKKSDLTSAHVSISSEDIQKTVNTTVEQAIQGRAAGVYVTQNSGQPGGAVSVNIRGLNSISGSNEPLYVIDGVQVQPSNVSYGVTSSTNPLAGLNPADIASIDVLQGPSATAIYGSRGTNGVVIITTKRGKAGDMQINYGFTYSLQEKPDALPVMNLRQYAQMTNEMRALTGGTAPTEFLDPSVLGEGTNWQNELFRRAPLNKHQLSLSGGSEKTTFYLSGEYFTQDGVAIGSEFDRQSLRLNVDNETRKWLKISANLNVNQTKDELGTTQDNIIPTAINMAPYIPVRTPGGAWGGADENNGASVQHTPINPIAIANLTQNTLRRRQAQGSVIADATIIEGLHLRSTVSGDARYSKSQYFIPTWQIGLRSNPEARLDVRNGTNTSWIWNQQLQYNKSFGKHSIDLMALHESQESRWENLFGQRFGFLSNDIRDLNAGNTDKSVNGGGQGEWAMESYLGRINYSFNDRYILQGAFRADGSSNFGPGNKWGYFPSVSAAWRISEEAFIKDNLPVISDLKLRFETGVTGNQGTGGIYGALGSTATPWGTGFYLGRYPNPDLQWEETMTNNIGFNLALFKNRIQLEGDFYVKKTSNLLMPGSVPEYLGATGQGAIAPPIVNAGELENRGYGFTLNTINYDKGGFSWSTNFNITAYKTKLVDLYAETPFIDRVPWYGNFGLVTQRAEVGQEPWLMRGYVYDGIFQTLEEVESSARPVAADGSLLPVGVDNIYVGDIKYKDLNEDGKIDAQDITTIGNPWPDFTFGFTNNLSYKGFDLMVFLTGSQGNDIMNYLRFQNTLPGNINLGRNLLLETYDYARVAHDDNGNPYLENPGTSVPRLSANDANGHANRMSSKYVEDGSYIRIKNIVLGYNLPQSIISKQSFVRNIRLSAGVQNLATFTDYSGYDPEVGAYVGAEVQANVQTFGVDFGRYPITPIYTFSLNVDF
jgi:TonB-linked SusC/RagA family outer membrane protein